MSTEKSVNSLSSLSDAINSLKFGESITLNLGDLIRNTLKDIESEREELSKKDDSEQFSPFNTVNS